MKVDNRDMRTPLRFSLLVGGAIFGIGLIDMMFRPPDTMNGVVIAWDSLLRLAVKVFAATLGFVGSFLALRFAKARYLSYPRALTVVVLYAICSYLPAVFSKPVTVQVDKTGHVEGDSGFWWSLAEPLIVPFACRRHLRSRQHRGDGMRLSVIPTATVGCCRKHGQARSGALELGELAWRFQ